MYRWIIETGMKRIIGKFRKIHNTLNDVQQRNKAQQTMRMEPIRVKKKWSADVSWNSKRRKYILQQIIPLNEWQTRNR